MVQESYTEKENLLKRHFFTNHIVSGVFKIILDN